MTIWIQSVVHLWRKKRETRLDEGMWLGNQIQCSRRVFDPVFCCCCSFWTQGKSINEVVILESQWAFSCRFNVRRIPFELDELSAESIDTTFLKPLGPECSKWECEEVRNFREVLNLSCSRGSLFTPVAFRIRDRHRSVRCIISSGYGQSFSPSRNRRESLSRRVQRRET